MRSVRKRLLAITGSSRDDQRLKPIDQQIEEAILGGLTREADILAHCKLKRNGNNRHKIRRVKKQLAQKGFSPEHDYVHVVPDGFKVKGVSTYYNEEGKPAGQWVKSTADLERQSEILRGMFDGLTDELPRMARTAPPRGTSDDLLNLFSLWDYHLGMLAWHEEAGEDWDTDIAEELLYRWLSRSLVQSPPASQALLVIGGDFAHWDGLDAVTPESKHLLDADTRFQKMARVMIRCARRMIDDLLETHKTVYLKWIEGNHDPSLSAMMREWIRAMYEKEPRLNVDISPNPYAVHEHGETILFFHHGHKRGMVGIDSTFAGQFRKEYGRTKYAYAHVGHKHCQELKETNLMVVEQHGTLAPRDAYAARGGWNQSRAAKVITYSKSWGEVGRVTITPEMCK